MNERDKNRRFQALIELGCLCCWINQREGFNVTFMPVEVHHLNAGGLAGGKRLGDEFTIPLCTYHHRGRGFAGTLPDLSRFYGPSWAGGSKPFRALYGSDACLLETADKAIDWARVR